MPVDAGNGDGREAMDPGAAATPGSDSLLGEMRAAAEAAVGYFRTLAATGAAEARLSAASLVALAAAALAALAFLILFWISLLALGIWLAVAAGAPVWAALAGGALVNVAGVLACRLWLGRLLPNLRFTRTRRLLGEAEGTWPSAG
jgi:hypothetical protein